MSLFEDSDDYTVNLFSEDNNAYLFTVLMYTHCADCGGCLSPGETAYYLPNESILCEECYDEQYEQ